MEGVVILSLMDKSKNRLFIHKDMEHVSLTQSVEIILTPQFYTFIDEKLDIKFTYQAKQIAQSLFDDYIDNSKEYQYHVTKTKESWYFYAYRIDEIEDFLEKIGIEKYRISKIYFAQELKDELQEPIQLSENTVLQSVDNIVTIIPKRLIDSNSYIKSLDLNSIKLNSGVTLGAAHNSIVSLKQTTLLASLLLILGAIFIVEAERTKSSISKDDEQLIALLDENPTYGSSMIRKSILEKYKPIDQSERTKRQTIKDISKLLSAKSELTTLKIEKSTIHANIKTANSTIAKQVIQSAKAKGFSTSIEQKNVKVEKRL